METATKESMVEGLMHQMKTVGFCVVTNVKDHDEDSFFKAVKAFHDFPQEIKDKLALQHFVKGNRNRYHGYFPFLDNDPSHKEFYDVAKPLEMISDWEKKGCALYETSPWITEPGLID